MDSDGKSDRSNPDVVRVLEQIEQHLAAIRSAAARPPREWLSVQDVANELQVSRDTVERLIAAGKIKASELNTNEGTGLRHRYRIHKDWLEAFLLAHARTDSSSTINRSKRPLDLIDFIGD